VCAYFTFIEGILGPFTLMLVKFNSQYIGFNPWLTKMALHHCQLAINQWLTLTGL